MPSFPIRKSVTTNQFAPESVVKKRLFRIKKNNSVINLYFGIFIYETHKSRTFENKVQSKSNRFGL